MQLVTNNFKTHLVTSFIEGIEEVDSYYFLGAHRNLKFTNDMLPPEPQDDLNSTHYQMFDELLFGKHITSNDVKPMIANIPWVEGTVYQMYDSRVTGLANTNFYVVSQESGEYHIFKCLNNNGGVPSTARPKRSETSPNDVYYRTNDGYEWKYMYTITPSEYLKFATSSFIPVIVNSDVTANSVPGAIDTIIIEDAGSSYLSFATGSFKESAIDGDPLIYSIETNTSTPLSQDDHFYENCAIYVDSGPGDGEIRVITDYFITANEKIILIDSPFATTPNKTSTFTIAPRVFVSGDGTGAKARAVVNTGTGALEEIVIINRGKDYTYASVEVVGNTGSTTASTIASATARAIISPPSGHGGDPVNELYATHIGIGVSFDKDEAGTIPVTNDYRKISLIRNPMFDTAVLTLSQTVASTGLSLADVITQKSSGAKGTIDSIGVNTITIKNITGFFTQTDYTLDDFNNKIYDANSAIMNPGEDIGYVTSIDRSFETFDQRNIYSVVISDDGPLNTGFLENEIVVQSGLNQTLMVDIIKLTLDGIDTAYLFDDGETVSQENGSTTATAVVIGRNGNVLTLSSPTSYFTVNASVLGLSSGATANVNDYDNTFAATATGAIHEISIVGSNGTIALSDVQGTFALSDTNTNTINRFKGQTSQAIADLYGIDVSNNKIVDGSGEILYVENFVPIVRDPDQTERIKLIIEF